MGQHQSVTLSEAKGLVPVPWRSSHAQAARFFALQAQNDTLDPLERHFFTSSKYS